MLRVLSRLTVLVVLLGVLSLSDATVGLTAAPTDRQDAARQLLATPAARFLTPQAATALATVANGARRLGEDASIACLATPVALDALELLLPSLDAGSPQCILDDRA